MSTLIPFLLIFSLVGSWGCGLTYDPSLDSDDSPSSPSPDPLPTDPPDDTPIEPDRWQPSNIDADRIWTSDSLTEINPTPIASQKLELRFDTDKGSIGLYDSAGERIEWIRPPGGQGINNGIEYFRSNDDQNAGVFIMQSLRLEQGVCARGIGARTLAIFARDTIAIADHFSVDASDDGPGSGGFAGGKGHNVNNDDIGNKPGQGPGGGEGDDLAGSLANDARDGGGAGGSFGSQGGRGGHSSSGIPKDTYGTLALMPLIGGSGGGTGGYPGGPGGHGGGALQLSAGRFFYLGNNGLLSANGSGGIGGQLTGDGGSGGGGGGGSGGAILVESPIVTLEGRLAANGGGGASGSHGPTRVGIDGSNGSAEQVPAPGGDGAGQGAPGGAGSDAEGNAKDGSDIAKEGGGGGGGAGRIRINTFTGTDTPGGITPTVGSGLATVGKIRVD